jgi:hypothetical protein
MYLPEKEFEASTAGALIKDSIGHHRNGRGVFRRHDNRPFDYSGPLTEAALLGNAPIAGQKLVDWKHLRAVNCPEADRYIQHHYRKRLKI